MRWRASPATGSRSGSVKSRNVDRSREFDKRERVGALPSFSSFSAARTVTCITTGPRHCRASRTDRRDRRCAYEVGIRLAIFVKRSVVGFLPFVSMTALSTFSTIGRMSFGKRSANRLLFSWPESGLECVTVTDRGGRAHSNSTAGFAHRDFSKNQLA